MTLKTCLSTHTDLIGSKCERLGASCGFLGNKKIYLKCHHDKWEVVKLNIFQRLVRKIFGFYASTHLNHISNELTFLKETEKTKSCQQRIEELWRKKLVVQGNSSFKQAEIIIFDPEYDSYQDLKSGKTVKVNERFIKAAIKKILSHAQPDDQIIIERGQGIQGDISALAALFPKEEFAEKINQLQIGALEDEINIAMTNLVSAFPQVHPGAVISDIESYLSNLASEKNSAEEKETANEAIHRYLQEIDNMIADCLTLSETLFINNSDKKLVVEKLKKVKESLQNLDSISMKKKEFLQKFKSILFITNQCVLRGAAWGRQESLGAPKNKKKKNKRTFVILSPYATKKRALYKQVGTEKTAAAALKGLKFAVVKHPKSCRRYY